MSPINEATIKRRERWPLEFDLEGVPHDQRAQLMEGQLAQPKNTFAVDYQSESVMDINNPNVPRYGTPKNPYNEFPKILYAEGKKPVSVDSAKEQAKLEKLGYQTQPIIKKQEESVA